MCTAYQSRIVGLCVFPALLGASFAVEQLASRHTPGGYESQAMQRRADGGRLSLAQCSQATSAGSEADTARLSPDNNRAGWAQDRRAEQDAERGTLVELAEGRLRFVAPAGWRQVEPRVRLIDAEFSAPPAEGEETPGRMTVMPAGGTVAQNIDRWRGQFRPDADQARPQATVEEKEIDGMKVHWVDIRGLYLDAPGPAAPPVQRPGYRMLGAVVETGGHGNYYFKFYGPQPTIAEHHQRFLKSLESLQLDR